MDTTDVSIELGESSHHHCTCCSGDSETVHGFLYGRAGETAVYMAAFTRGHGDVYASMVLSLGGWGENTGPDDRLAFPLRIAREGERLRLYLMPRESSPWFGDTMFGRMATDDELTTDDLTSLDRLAMSAVEGDPRLRAYFASAGPLDD